MPNCPLGTYQYTIQPQDNLWSIAQRFHTTFGAIAAHNPHINFDYLHTGQVICIPVAMPEPTPGGISNAEYNLNRLLRSLWEQHVSWTRMTIISIAEDLKDVDLVTNRLLKNPSDFEAALRPLYGSANAAKFKDLFTQHLVIAAELVKAAKAGDTAAAQDAEKRWYANADEIVAFLHSINPYFDQGEWRRMLHEHLAMTKSEAVNRLNKKYAADIADYDKIEQQALQMADQMTRGIVRQFPQNFGR